MWDHVVLVEWLLVPWTVILAAVFAAGFFGASSFSDSEPLTTTILWSERKLLKHLRLPRRAVVRKFQDGSFRCKEWPPKFPEDQQLSLCVRGFQFVRDYLRQWWQKTRIPWDELRLETDERISKHMPLLVFVNSKSGGGQGAKVLEDLRQLLHYVQVIDFRQEGLEPPLSWWSKTSLRYRVLVCGGDGTVGAVLGCLEKLKVDYVPPVAIMPLGTGNDLARVTRWGGGVTGSQMAPILKRVGEADAAMLDRWQVTCRDAVPEGKPATPTRPAFLPSPEPLVMCNYFGIGVDAAVALDFHRMRERSPHLFASRLLNKLLYLHSSINNIFQSKRSCKDLKSKVVLECDGKEVELPKNLEGIIVLNIGSFAGGCDLWGSANDDPGDNSDSSGEDSSNESRASDGLTSSSERSGWRRPSMHDQLLEVVGIRGLLQLGAAQVGLSSATRLAQARHVLIRNKVALPVQVDGEPWLFARGGEVEISWRSQAIMLAQRPPGNSSQTTATELVDWALQQEVISMEQRTTMMREIARRAQRKSSAVSLSSMG